MASIHREKRNGKTYYRVYFYDRDRERQAIRLGRVNCKAAEAIKTRVEALVSASISGAPLDNQTAEWVAEVGDDLHGKLVRAGLVQPRVVQSAGLGKFTDDYITSRTDAKPNTIRNLKNSRAKLVDFFGEARDLRDITPGNADDWRQWMVSDRKLSEATVSKAVKHAKHFLRLAGRKGLVEGNAFDHLAGGSERNDSRKQFISRKTIDKVIEAAPDAEWRLIIALARYGGVRTPSETLALRWRDVDLAAGRLTVTSPKTARHGKGYRTVPIFPELRPYLEDAFDQAEEGAEWVVRRYRDRNSNLRTQLLRILKRAGVQPWHRLFHNLRAQSSDRVDQPVPRACRGRLAGEHGGRGRGPLLADDRGALRGGCRWCNCRCDRRRSGAKVGAAGSRTRRARRRTNKESLGTCSDNRRERRGLCKQSNTP